MRCPTIVVRSEVLTSWLTVSDYSQSRLAMELGISKGRVSQLLSSHREPSAHLIAKLMSLTHLPFERLFKVIHNLNFSKKSAVKKETVLTSSGNGGNGK